jgi:hypothetical protein
MYTRTSTGRNLGFKFLFDRMAAPLSFSWSVGPSLTSTRASHCAVGLGNGSIIVTGKQQQLIFRQISRLCLTNNTGSSSV